VNIANTRNTRQEVPDWTKEYLFRLIITDTVDGEEVREVTNKRMNYDGK
jgi:hypothetical protein